jgi:hypothetical protein
VRNIEIRMIAAWIFVALAFGIPFVAGIAMQEWLETREPRNVRYVSLLYLWVPLSTATLVAFLQRAQL